MLTICTRQRRGHGLNPRPVYILMLLNNFSLLSSILYFVISVVSMLQVVFFLGGGLCVRLFRYMGLY